MKIEHWHILLDSRRGIRAAIDNSLSPESGPGQTGGAKRVGPEALAALRGKLLNEILDLKGKLGEELDEREVDMAARPVTLHVDEMVKRRVADSEQGQWRLLQKELFGRDDGGEYFYDYTDEKLASPETPPFAFEVLHFCLTAGFVGRYVGNTVKLREYKEKLAKRIPKPEPRPPVAPKPPAERPIQEFPYLYYIVAAGVVVAVPFLLWGLSR